MGQHAVHLLEHVGHRVRRLRGEAGVLVKVGDGLLKGFAIPLRDRREEAARRHSQPRADLRE